MISKEEAYNKYKHFLLEPYDIVMSCSGTLGRYAIIQDYHLPLCLNTSVIRFRPKIECTDFCYIYGYLISEEFLNKQLEMACGSVQSNFGPTHLKRITINNYSPEKRLSFYNNTISIILHFLELQAENVKLSNMRNELLPKLMSGEIDVSKIDI